MTGIIRTRKGAAFLVAVFLFLCFPMLVTAEIKLRDTKHNLSVSGKGRVVAAQETQICVFCHTPHNADPAQPLWNHQLSAVQTYRTYWSNTLQAYTEAESHAWTVDGYSKLCLSCHDGTIALGAIMNRANKYNESRSENILMEPSSCIDGSGRLIDGGPECTGYLGTNLSGGHPISVVLDQALIAKRNDPSLGLSHIKLPDDVHVKLYPSPAHGCFSRCAVQCTSCHDPHSNRTTEIDKDGNPFPPFWQKETYSSVCLACHEDIPPEGNIQW